MNEPRYQRRKADRPQEIVAAAFAAFAEHGYAGTRIEDVARRAGVSKGLTYRYFRTKEELFKAVIRNVVSRRVEALTRLVEHTELPSEEFVRGPLLAFMKAVPGSRIPVVIRLMVAEGARHPDLVEYYWANVVGPGLAAIRRILERGVARGEFRRSAVNELPQLFLAPMMLSIVWKILFPARALDTDRLMETQLDMLLAYIRAGRGPV